MSRFYTVFVSPILSAVPGSIDAQKYLLEQRMNECIPICYLSNFLVILPLFPSQSLFLELPPRSAEQTTEQQQKQTSFAFLY